MRYKFRHLLLAATVLMLVARTAFPVIAQDPTGSIRGTVKDEQGAVIQNAAITVTNKATGDVRKSNTGGDGIFQVSALLPGDYEVKIEAQGFATQILNLLVQVGNTSSGDTSLRAGAPDEIVDVTAEAPIIDKQNFKIDGVVTRQKIDALPLNGRNFLQLAALEPGVSVSTSNPGNANNLFNVSIGGAPSALTRITVDGGSVLDYVTGGAAQNFSTETIQEFQISTFNFDLATGVTGVGAVNIVSRTGTNDFHGNAFVYFRDDSIAAVPTLQQGAPDFRRYQYGGSFGGPIKKDRALFFGNVEWLDQDAVFSTRHQASAGFRGISQFDIINPSPYDGVVANIRFDFPGFINDKNTLFARYSYDNNDTFGPTGANTLPSNWRVNSNADHNIQTGLTTLLNQNVVNDFRFNYQRIRNDSLLPEESDCPSSNPGCIGRGGAFIQVLGSNLNLGNNVNAPQNRILDRYQFRDDMNWQKGAHRLRFGAEWEHDYGKGGWAFLDPALLILHDPASVIATNAAIDQFLPAAIAAQLRIPISPAFTDPNIPITLQDILNLPLAVAVVGLGNPEQPPPFNQSTARQSNRYRFYAQDSWQVRSDFTFTFGASYQYETNLFNHDLPKPELLRLLIGDLNPSPKDKNNIAPSIGFAWDVGGNGKTVIRGGGGIYYDTTLFVTRLRERATIGPAGNGRSQLFGSSYANTVSFPCFAAPGVPCSAVLPPPFNLITPGIGAGLDFRVIPTKFTGQNFLDIFGAQNTALLAQLEALGGSGVTNIELLKTGTDILDPGNVTPYSEQVSIGVQHQLKGNMAVSADFVMRNRLHTLSGNLDYNLFNRAPDLGGPVIPRCVGAQASDPSALCSTGPISILSTNGREQYKALLVKLDKRFSNRYQFTASYALSTLKSHHTGENLTNYFGNFGYDGADARHRFTFSGVLDLPWGFQTSLISHFSTKGPFNARLPSDIDINGDGTGGDVLPGLEINSLNRGVDKADLQTLVNQFNASLPALADENGIPRDADGTPIPPLFLPPDFTLGDFFQFHDVRVTKSFKFAERYELQGIFEVFNVFNNANLGGFSTSLDKGSLSSTGQLIAPTTFRFAQPTNRAGQNFGSGGPRALQFAARFTF
ncbi:MAG: TonB-dependent receptor [Blastocatellia bacterium]|nr:TonB-dependent receptor [Blastocatellia bacterium]